MSHQIHTTIYIDGENFTTRCEKYVGEIEQIPNQPKTPPSININLWIPQPNSVEAQSMTDPHGVAYRKNIYYWDYQGIVHALQKTAAGSIWREFLNEKAERSIYFTSCKQSEIRQVEELLHHLGFNPYVFAKKKPRGFAEEMKKEGITVIDKPKPLDITLAAQILEDAANDNFHRCILVSGDEDYVPLIEAVKRRGKIVWVVAIEKYLSPKGKLRLICDRFIPYESVLEARPWAIAEGV